MKRIIKKIDELQKKHKCAIIFCLNDDESGVFEEYWSNEVKLSFNNLEELENILKDY